MIAEMSCGKNLFPSMFTFVNVKSNIFSAAYETNPFKKHSKPKVVYIKNTPTKLQLVHDA